MVHAIGPSRHIARNQSRISHNNLKPELPLSPRFYVVLSLVNRCVGKGSTRVRAPACVRQTTTAPAPAPTWGSSVFPSALPILRPSLVRKPWPYTFLLWFACVVHVCTAACEECTAPSVGMCGRSRPALPSSLLLPGLAPFHCCNHRHSSAPPGAPPRRPPPAPLPGALPRRPSQASSPGAPPKRPPPAPFPSAPSQRPSPAPLPGVLPRRPSPAPLPSAPPRRPSQTPVSGAPATHCGTGSPALSSMPGQ